MSSSQFHADNAVPWLQSKVLMNAIHDLRGVLQVARGYARLAADFGIDQPSRTAEYTANVLVGLEKLALKIDELKTVTDVYALDLREVNLSELLQAEAAEVSSIYNCRIVVDAPEPLFIVGDWAKLKNALSSLLVSVVVFTGPERCMCLTSGGHQGRAVIEIRFQGANRLDPHSLEINEFESLCSIHGGRSMRSESGDLSHELRFEFPLVR